MLCRTASSRPAAWRYGALIACCCGLACSASLTAAETAFPLPGAKDPVLWEAEAASKDDAWETIRDVRAHGGAYVRSKHANGVLTFSFETQEPTTLAVETLWWRHGDQNPAQRFPHPWPRSFGPAALTPVGTRLFWTAPACGRVGVVDTQTNRLEAPIEIGGYPADMVFAGERLVVADAANNQLMVIDPERRAVLQRIAVPALPWSMAATKERLFVACSRAKKIAVLDLPDFTISHELSVDGVPLRLAVADPQTVSAEVAPFLLDPTTLREEFPDRFVYKPLNRREAGYPFAMPVRTAEQRFSRSEVIVSAEKSGELSVRGPGAKPVDVRKLTAPPANAPTPPPGTKAEEGPTTVDEIDSLAYFTAPAAGQVGVFDMKKLELLDPISVSGYAADLLTNAQQKKLYVLDASNHRVRVVSTANRKLLREIAVPAHPVAVIGAAGRVFIYSRGANVVTVVDGASDAVVHSVQLPVPTSTMEAVELSPSYMLDDLWKAPPTEAPVKLLFPLPRQAWDMQTLKPAIAKSGELAARSRETKLGGKRYSARENAHSINVDGGAIDTSTVTDPQQLPEPALLAQGDRSGSIQLTIDDGPAHDWKRDIWITPDNGTYLVNESAEFWKWNAPRLIVGAGKHRLCIRSNSPFVHLDGLRVRAEASLDLSARPLPDAIHAAVPLPNYQGVFTATEPTRFAVILDNRLAVEQSGQLRTVVRDLRHRSIAKSERSLRLPAGSTPVEIEPAVAASGVFELELTFDSESSKVVRIVRFVRLPKLEHPRLILRKEELPAIAARMQSRPTLFARYRQWLRWRLETSSILPENFAAKYPMSDYKNEENKWPLIALQTMALLSEPDDAELFGRATAPFGGRRYQDFGSVSSFLHNCFPGISVCLDDLRSHGDPVLAASFAEKFRTSLGNSSYMAESLMALREPLTPRMRAVAYRHGQWLANLLRYFEQHAGRRGGNWWLTHRTGCCCPLHGVGRSILFCRNFFGIDDLMEVAPLGGLFTHYAYVDPPFDALGCYPSFLRGGEGRGSCVMRDVVPAMARHPLIPDDASWRELTTLMNDPNVDSARVLAIMDGYPQQAAIVPLFVALGWYDPDLPAVQREELPPTIHFDAEGEVVMNSNWQADGTRVYFTCGRRDMIYRWHPGHFEFMKAGHMLIGTASLGTDHGQPTPAWSNTVVAGDDWRDWWLCNVGHPRGMNQHLCMNRHAPAIDAYIRRDQELSNYSEPGGAGRGYALGLHTHSRHPFIQEGRIDAYQTTPAFDYVAGDMTNAWRPEVITRATRQLVFVKPDVVIVYDRLQLADPAQRVHWMAATGPKLSIDQRKFAVSSGKARLRGEVLWPPEGPLADVRDDPRFADFTWKTPQRLLQISAPNRENQQEFLVVMAAGLEGKSMAAFESVITATSMGVEVRQGSGKVRVELARSGPPAGHIRIEASGPASERLLAIDVQDHYRDWQSDPRYRRWVDEKRFRFLAIDE